MLAGDLHGKNLTSTGSLQNGFGLFLQLVEGRLQQLEATQDVKI